MHSITIKFRHYSESVRLKMGNPFCLGLVLKGCLIFMEFSLSPEDYERYGYAVSLLSEKLYLQEFILLMV